MGTRTAGSFNNEGVILREAGRLDAAAAAFEQALKLDPQLGTAEHNLSVLLTDKHPAKADQLLLSALSHGLGNGPNILVSAALSHEHAGNVDRARRLIDGAVASMPTDPTLRLNRGRFRLDGRSRRGALEDFDVARREAPTSALAHGLAGTSLLYPPVKPSAFSGGRGARHPGIVPISCPTKRLVPLELASKTRIFDDGQPSSTSS